MIIKCSCQTHLHLITQEYMEIESWQLHVGKVLSYYMKR